jgi:hypothetical protein
MRKRSRQGANFTKLTSVILRVRRDDGKRFVVQADEKLPAFLELARVLVRLDHVARVIIAGRGSLESPG